MFAQTSSVYLTVAVTVERWFAIVDPLMARTTNTTSKARKSILCVLLGSMVYNVPRFLEFTYNEAENEVKPTALREDSIYEVVYMVVLYMLVMYVIPACLLGILNIQIALAIHRARLHRHSISASSCQEQQRQRHRNSSTDFLGSRRTRYSKLPNNQLTTVFENSDKILTFLWTSKR